MTVFWTTPLPVNKVQDTPAMTTCTQELLHCEDLRPSMRQAGEGFGGETTLQDGLESGNMELGVDGESLRKMKPVTIGVDELIIGKGPMIGQTACGTPLLESRSPGGKAQLAVRAPSSHSEEQVTCYCRISVNTWC